MKVRRYEVDICDGCINLEPSECHTPGCIFFLCGMNEVREYLNRMLIRPTIDGELLPNLQPEAVIVAPRSLPMPKKNKRAPKSAVDAVRQRDIDPKDPEMKPEWNRKCEVCGESPIVPCTGMCGPCTFGEAETALGNW